MLEGLKKTVREMNQRLPEMGLVELTFGNASAIEEGVIAIKPSGIDFDRLEDSDVVLVDLKGNVVEGERKPSSDLLTHLELYNAFQGIGAVIHTHSTYATAFAQAATPLRCFGTTHADYFNGTVPVIPLLEDSEIKEAYELNTGKQIVTYFNDEGLDPLQIPACLVQGHGPFVWGGNPQQALENAIVLEKVAKMNFRGLVLNPKMSPLKKALLDKHYFRKHGKDAYYGQKNDRDITW